MPRERLQGLPCLFFTLLDGAGTPVATSGGVCSTSTIAASYPVGPTAARGSRLRIGPKTMNPYPADLAELYDFTEPLVLSCGRPGADVLDVGCGDGRLARLLQMRLGAKVTAFDIRPDRVQEACRKNPGPRYVVGDAEDRGFMSSLGRFDLVLARNTFHHFAHKAEFLANVPPLLKPGGVFLCIDLDWRANYSWLGVLAMHLKFMVTHRPAVALRLLKRTHLFLGEAMRQHRRTDRETLKAQGWYRAGAVRRGFRQLLPGVEVRRMGTILGFGGAYAAIWRAEGGNKCNCQ